MDLYSYEKGSFKEESFPFRGLGLKNVLECMTDHEIKLIVS